MILLKCTVFNTTKMRFIKEQEASGLLSSLGTKTSLRKISLVGLLLKVDFFSRFSFVSKV